MDITILNRQRGNIKAQITKIISYLKDETPTVDEIKLSTKLETVIKLEKKTKELKIDYYKIVKDEDLAEHEDVFSEIEDSIQDLKVGFKQLLNSLSITKTRDNVSAEENIIKQTMVKLPEIPLPRFSGNYTEWLHFKTQFKTLINDNSQLNEKQKLY